VRTTAGTVDSVAPRPGRRTGQVRANTTDNHGTSAGPLVRRFSFVT
jgi:hypothetical protein